ncbi:MAG: amidohydrolase [Chloroflexi bacterium]|nr:amidohydrolase [Chloroflexota bacterium]
MTYPAGIKVIDGKIMENPPSSENRPRTHRPDEVRYLLGAKPKETTIDEMVAIMDEVGIEKGILEVATNHHEDYDQDTGIKAVRKYPDRFIPYCSDFSVNPRDGMAAVRKLEMLVKEFGVKLWHTMPSRVRLAVNDKMYYPLFAKCIELDIVASFNVGIPGPNDPSWFQDPIYVDEVCWFFPELRAVMTHMGEPWQFMCVKLMLKYPNLYYFTNSFAPRHYNSEIIQYMNTRGADKIIFATGYPTMSFERVMTELKDLPLRDHVWPKFLRENAIRVFKL